MLHPRPGVVFQSSLQQRTTGIASVSPKQSTQTNSPLPSHNRLRRTPYLGYHTIPNRRSIHDTHNTANVPPQLRLWPTPVDIRFPLSMVLAFPLVCISVALVPFLKTPSRTSTNPNQGLGSVPGTVSSTISNTTQKGTQPAPFYDPFTVRLGRGLQLLR